MKKRMLFFILAMLTLSLLASHAISETLWERDANEHWILNENEERTQVGAHKMNDIICEVCQSNIWLFEDGTINISNYNEYEDITRYSYYEADGTLLDDYIYLYTYDDNGMKLYSQTYFFEFLVEETEYGIDPFGFSVVKKTIGYNDDGSESLVECDEYGNTVFCKMTDADGHIFFEEKYEYTYGEDGFPTHTIQTSFFDDGTCFRTESDAMGNHLFKTQIDPDGTIVYAFTYAYEYDKNGRIIRELISENGQPVFETFYAYEGDDFWGYQYMTIDYFTDGSKTVCELDEFGDIITETMYDAEGKIVS